MSKMRKKVLTALAGATLALTGCAAEQPSPGCYVQDGTWLFRYTNQAISGNCSAAQTASFATFEGEQTGVFKFREIGAQGGKLVIRPRRAGAYGAQDSDPSPAVNSGVFPNNEKANATGTLPDQPSGEGFDRYCTVGDMSPIDVPSITTAGASRKYTYTNVKVYAGARALGTQLSARVRFEDITAAGTCIMDADAYAIWPAVGCNPEDMNSADAEPENKCGLGSLMNQDVQYVCAKTGFAINPASDPPDLRITRCAVANPTPSFKEGVEELEYAD